MLRFDRKQQNSVKQLSFKKKKKNLPTNAGDMGSVSESGRPLEEEMAAHVSVLAWEILWTEEPGGHQVLNTS